MTLDTFLGLLAIIILSRIGIYFFETYYLLPQEPKVPVDFNQFNASELHGHIKYVDTNARNSYFNIKEDSIRYYRVYLNEINTDTPKLFSHRASIGDSIAKQKYGTVLLLITTDGTHYYHVSE